MSFIYSQALVAASSLGSCLDIEQSAPSSGSRTHKLCCWHDKQTEHSRLSRFGVMCKPLTDDHGKELLTSWLEGFRVRTSVLPEKVQDSMVREADYGATLPASLAKYDPTTHSLKTAQCSLIEDLTGCSVTLPRSGLMRNGVCSERTIAMPITSGKDASFWPTPTRDSATERTKRYAQGGMPLTMAVSMYPTPTVHGNYNRKGLSKSSADGLATAVSKMMFRSPSAHVIEEKSTVVKLTGRKPSDPQVGLADQVMALECKRMFATATATAYKGWSPNHNRADTDDRLDYTIEREGYSPGQTTPPMRLNPDWVEWLMGWPIGHTELKPLGMGRFQEWQQQHSIY